MVFLVVKIFETNQWKQSCLILAVEPTRTLLKIECQVRLYYIEIDGKIVQDNSLVFTCFQLFTWLYTQDARNIHLPFLYWLKIIISFQAACGQYVGYTIKVGRNARCSAKYDIWTTKDANASSILRLSSRDMEERFINIRLRSKKLLYTYWSTLCTLLKVQIEKSPYF